MRSLPDEKRRVSTRTGYMVPPGSYRVRMRLGDETHERDFEIARDPRVAAKDEDLREQFELLIRIRDIHSSVNDAIARTRKIRAQLEPWSRRPDADDSIRAGARRICKALTEVEKVLTNPAQTHGTDFLKLPLGLDGKLADLPAAISGADARPTKQSREVFDKHRTLAESTLARLDEIAESDVVAFERALREADISLVDTAGPEVEIRDT